MNKIHLKHYEIVCHKNIWATMRKYNINGNLVHVTEHLYDKAISDVQMNGSTGEWFKTTARR